MPDPDATPMQLEESEETCRPKHRALPANVSKEEFDAHPLTHLPFRSWCDHCVRGQAVDGPHRPRIDPHRGESRIGMDCFFLATTTDPQHAKAVLNMGAAESSAAQPTSSAVRTLETEDDASAKRQRLMAGMPTVHETDVDVHVDAHKMVVLAAMPDDHEQWTQRVIDWDKKYHGAKSGTLLDTEKAYEGRLREVANIEKLAVAEPIPLQDARSGWMVQKETPEDPDAVRSRLVAKQANTYAREDVTQATPPITAPRIIVSQATTKKREGPSTIV